MDTQAESIIRSLAQKQLPREAIRAELISQGFSTAGFESAYAGILKELHIEEPATVTAEAKLATMGFRSEQLLSKHSSRTRSKRPLFIFLLCVVLILGVWFLFLRNNSFVVSNLRSLQHTGNATTSGEVDTSVGDYVLRSKVETTAASAHYYGNSMGSYDGVCKDIVVVDPIQCNSVANGYAITVTLSNKMIYCADGTGFKGEVDQSSLRPGFCK